MINILSGESNFTKTVDNRESKIKMKNYVRNNKIRTIKAKNAKTLLNAF